MRFRSTLVAATMAAGAAFAGSAHSTAVFVGTGTNGEGFKLFRWRESSSDWLQINGGGVRIDMQGGTPWVVTNDEQGPAVQLCGRV